MMLDGLPRGTRVFVDANIFHYALVEIPPVSATVYPFMDRIAQGEVTAFTSESALGDAVHKVMLSEAVQRFGLERANLVGWLKRNPDAVRQLSRPAMAARRLQALPLRCLHANDQTLTEAAAISARYGLLTNDAAIVSLMGQQGLTHIVTNDDDFDRVTDLTVWKPR